MKLETQLQENGLERSERRYRSLVEAVSAAQAVWVANANGEYREDSPSWRQLTGQTFDQFRGWGWLDAVHPDDREKTRDVWESAVRNRSRYETEYRLRIRNGEFHWFAARGVRVLDDNGKVLEWIGTSTDIHDHRTREGATRFLLKAEEVFASSLDERTILQRLARLAVPRLADWCTVDLIDENGAVDRIAVEHVDPSKVELAREMVRRYPPKRDLPYGIVETTRSGKAEVYDHISESMLSSLARNDEHLSSLHSLGMESFMIVPLTVRGSIIGAISFVYAESPREYERNDVALVEELARRAAIAVDNARLYADAQSANHAKDMFLAMLSHEMKTPLTAILGWTRIMRMDEPPEEFREALVAIEQSALVQQRLIDDLLDVSRVIAGKLHIEPRTVDVRDALRKAIEIMQPTAKDKSIAVWTEIPDEEILADADPTRLQQIFWNLLNNAVKFTPDGGLIEVSAIRDDRDVLVTVRDTGRGIDVHMLPYLFEVFRQSAQPDGAEHKGLGLGLAIVRNLVQMHGGAVEAQSEGEGKGATFTVRLPLRETQQ
jgi:PAS domain S-box-containing protein